MPSGLLDSALPLAAYVHLPWCVQKCPYCDFNSHALRGELPADDYVAALLKDLDADLAQFQAQLRTPAGVRPIETVFLGGGTPSLFSATALDALLTGLHRRLPLADDAEITLEANPGTIERGNFADYRAIGINRVSLGAQSFADEQLKGLGRIHAAADTRRAFDEARSAGFDRINLDLMYGLPGQSIAAAGLDLAQALELEPDHLSLYQLTLEPNTLFHRHPPELPDDDATWQMHIEAQSTLAGAGFDRYEVSAYARPDQACRHNLNYWRFGDYLGLGAGAHAKLTGPDRVALRCAKHRHPRHYLAQAATAARIGELRALSRDELPFEYFLNKLRLREPIVAAEFEFSTGLGFDTVTTQLARAKSLGLMAEHASGDWQVTGLGERFLNDLQAQFLDA